MKEEQIRKAFEEEPSAINWLGDAYKKEFDMLISGASYEDISQIVERNVTTVSYTLSMIAKMALAAAPIRDWWGDINLPRGHLSFLGRNRRDKNYATRDAFIKYASTVSGQEEILRKGYVSEEKLGRVLDALNIERKLYMIDNRTTTNKNTIKEEVINFFKCNPDAIDLVSREREAEVDMLMSGMSFREIAKSEGRTPSAISVRLFKEMRRIKKIMSGANWWDEADLSTRASNFIANSLAGRYGNKEVFQSKSAFLKYASERSGQKNILKMPNVGKKTLYEMLSAFNIQKLV